MCSGHMNTIQILKQHIELEVTVLPQSVDDDELSALLEFNDHEKTHMHYHLRRDVDDH